MIVWNFSCTRSLNTSPSIFFNVIFLATLVLSFTGEKSFVNVTSPSNVSSMAIQFKTTESNSQIVAMMSGSESFALNVRNGTLKLEYSFNQIGSGSFDLGMN